MKYRYIKFLPSLRSLFVSGCGDFDGNVQNFLSVADKNFLYAFVIIFDDGTEETRYYKFDKVEWIEFTFNIL